MTDDTTMNDVDYSMLPEHMQGAARDYVERGWPPGEFLLAVLTNDLVAAFGRADATNVLFMHQWAMWLYNECPSGAWGSVEKLQVWCLAHGEDK